MPIIMIQMLPGRSAKTKKALLKNMTDTIASTLNIKPEAVRIIIHEVPFLHYGIAGLPADEYRRNKNRAGQKPGRKFPAK